MNALEYLRRSLATRVTTGEEAAAKLAAALTKNLASAHLELDQMAGKAEVIVAGNTAAQVLALLEEKAGDIAAVRGMLEQRLLRWYPKQSTSAYANAVNVAEFNALRDLIQYLNVL